MRLLLKFLVRKKSLCLSLICLMLITTVGCNNSEKENSDEGSISTGDFVRFLSIEGDVEKNITMNNGTPATDDTAMPGDEDFEGISITEFIAEANVSGKPKTIYLFSSGDGFISSIDYEGAEDVYIYFSKVKGWSTVAPKHPPAASGMDIDRIVIVSENSEVGLHVINQSGELNIIPMGKLLMSPQYTEFHLDGTTTNESSGAARAVSLYTRQYSLRLSDVDENYSDVPFVVVTKSGDTYLTEGTGRFILYRQKINYKENTGDIYEDVAEIRLR